MNKIDVIEFKNVTKNFKIYQNKNYSLKEQFLTKVLRRPKMKVTIMNVLKNASFKIYQGETVGIIGENGTGKSTSLKLISNILKPNAGEIIVKGKISSLLEIGVGFQPDMTGKENVYMYGSILGLSKAEIDAKYDEIVDFAEIRAFMDTPVKNYSSGMYMRLAFSVAVSVNPDILLVDEVLAVGDANFQSKCINKIMSFKKQGKTIVFVSHDMGIVKRICDRAIFIKKGGYVVEGSTDRMIGLYMKLLYSASQHDKNEINKGIEENNLKDIEKLTEDVKFDIHEAQEFAQNERKGNQKLKITKLYFSDSAGMIRNVFSTGEDIKVNVEYVKNSDVKDAIFAFEIYTEEGWKLIYHNCKEDGLLITDLGEKNMISFIIRKNTLLFSKYYFSAILSSEDKKEIYDFMDRRFYFIIKENDIENEGKVTVDCDWQI